jgi:hypothetical protein
LLDKGYGFDPPGRLRWRNVFIERKAQTVPKVYKDEVVLPHPVIWTETDLEP